MFAVVYHHVLNEKIENLVAPAQQNLRTPISTFFLMAHVTFCKWSRMPGFYEHQLNLHDMSFMYSWAGQL